MNKWKKVVVTLAGVLVACATVGLMAGNAFAGGPVIVLDPGHSGTSVTTTDPETQIVDTEYPSMPEMQDVFTVATILKAKLEAAGYTVLMTKQAYTDTVIKRDRVNLANDSHAALAVSIHTSSSTFGSWGQIYVQRLDGYREDIHGNRVYFNLPAIASLSQQYGQIFLAERRKIEGNSSIWVTVDSTFGSRGLAPGNLPLVQLWSKVPWVYCEAGALQSDHDREMYAQSLYNSITACVPIRGTPPPPPPPTLVRYEQTDARIAKTGAWSDYSAPTASGGSYGRASTSGASATVYFTGTQLDWIAMKGTTTGVADVYLDGAKVSTVDLTATSATYNVPVWSTGRLPDGAHSVSIVRSKSCATGKFVTMDAVDIQGTISSPPTRYEQTDKRIVKAGTWSTFTASAASGGSYGRSSTSSPSPASATIYFTGTRLDWIAMQGTTAGIANVYLDGKQVATVNLNSTVTTYNVKVWSTGTLAPGNHTVRIERAGTGGTAYLTLDAVDITGVITSGP